MTEKEKTIDMMQNLLEFAKRLPMFSVDFCISADNGHIEEYLIDHVDRYDWNGNPLSSEEIENNIKKSIQDFRNSEFYNPNGVSMLKMRKCFSLPDIAYNNVYELVSGKASDMPTGYNFVGKMTLSFQK